MNTDRVLCEARSTVERVETLALLFIFTIDKRKKVCYNAAARARGEIFIITYPPPFCQAFFYQQSAQNFPVIFVYFAYCVFYWFSVY